MTKLALVVMAIIVAACAVTVDPAYTLEGAGACLEHDHPCEVDQDCCSEACVDGVCE